MNEQNKWESEHSKAMMEQMQSVLQQTSTNMCQMFLTGLKDILKEQ